MKGRWRSFGGALLLGAAALLAACASTAPPHDASWLAGRLSVHVQAIDDKPARDFSSAFELQGDAEQGELRLSSPLGTLMAVASWSPGVASLSTSQGRTAYSDLDALARDALGEALPLRALPSWLRGQPWPGAAHQTTASGFEQLGWQVGLARYSEGWLEVTRGSAPAVSLRARLERPA